MNKRIGVKRMHSELHNLDLIDLISERHGLLRKISEKLWNDSSNIYISTSEWYIMSRIYKNQPTISYVSKHVDISRQATHKFIKSLESKGLIEITNSKNNNKDKCLKLTTLGEECYEKNMSLKAGLEQKIAERIGVGQLEVLKDILKSDWGL
jgi:DNA-binding MarR family transcriptional regulator